MYDVSRYSGSLLESSGYLSDAGLEFIGKKVSLTAAHDILAGEEILVDYEEFEEEADKDRWLWDKKNTGSSSGCVPANRQCGSGYGQCCTPSYLYGTCKPYKGIKICY